MKLPGNIPLLPVLSLAQGLLQRLRDDEYCPHELRVRGGEGRGGEGRGGGRGGEGRGGEERSGVES